MKASCLVIDCGRHASTCGYCHMHYCRLRKHGDPTGGPPFKARKGQIEAFLAKAAAFDGDECLPWPFAKNSAGYGHFSRDGVGKLASRHVCEMVHGSPDEGMEAAHKCGNGHLGCVNGTHLVWKDRAGNAADMITHGTMQIGEKMWMSKLEASDVLVIRASTLPTSVLGRVFGVSGSNILSIKRRATWKHIP